MYLAGKADKDAKSLIGLLGSTKKININMQVSAIMVKRKTKKMICQNRQLFVLKKAGMLKKPQ